MVDKIYYGIYFNKEKRMETKWVTDSMKPLLKVLAQHEERLTNLLQLLGEYRDSEVFKKVILPSVDFYTQKVQLYSDMLFKVVNENLEKKEVPPPVVLPLAKSGKSGKSEKEKAGKKK